MSQGRTNYRAFLLSFKETMPMSDKDHAYLSMLPDVTSNGQQITRAIEALRKHSAELPRMAAVLAASCVLHAIEYGNATPCTQMLDALPKGWKQTALRTWFEVKGPLLWNDKAEKFGMHTEQKNRLLSRLATKDSRLKFCSELLSKPFTEFKPEPEFKAFNLQDALSRIVKQAGKLDANDPRHVGLQFIDDLRTFMVDKFTLSTLAAPAAGPEAVDEDALIAAMIAEDEATKKAA